MKTTFAFVVGALLLVGGAVRADILSGRIYCSPGLNASGAMEIQCENAPEGGGGDPGPGLPGPGDPAYSGISVVSATYGANCGAARGNQGWDLGQACDGAMSCGYVVDYRVIGDPAPGCAKTYVATYRCAGKKGFRYVYVGAEAGFDKVAQLSCD